LGKSELNDVNSNSESVFSIFLSVGVD
jgi:hypothetical protein